MRVNGRTWCGSITVSPLDPPIGIINYLASYLSSKIAGLRK